VGRLGHAQLLDEMARLPAYHDERFLPGEVRNRDTLLHLFSCSQTASQAA